jgi:hypothetical protein
MATLKQKRLAKAIVENSQSKEPKTAGQLLELAGYDKTTAEATPGRIIDQQGVQEELAKAGFTLEAADGVVSTLLQKAKKEETKIKAADLMYKRLGGYVADKQTPTTVNYNIFNRPEMKITVAEFEQRVKEQLMQQSDVQTTQEPLEA